MDFGKLHEESVKIEKHPLKIECLPENFDYTPLAIVIMTSADKIQPTFSREDTDIFMISDLSRVITEFGDTDIARMF